MKRKKVGMKEESKLNYKVYPSLIVPEVFHGDIQELYCLKERAKQIVIFLMDYA